MLRSLWTKGVILPLVAAVLAAPAAADDLWPPPWDPTLPNQTFVTWDTQFVFPQEVFPGAIIPPTDYENIYGLPLVRLTGEWEPVYEPGPRGEVILTWHVGEPGGQLHITIPNNPDPNLYKQIFWQITSDKSPTPTGDPPVTDPPGTALPSPYPHVQWQGTWYTYNGLLEIRPNPEVETITFDLVPSTNISQIVVKTVCIPEPASLALVALGGMALAVRRRRTSTGQR